MMMLWLNGLFTGIISIFILLSVYYIGKTYQLNRRLKSEYKLINCGDSGQIYFIRSLQIILILLFPVFILFDELPNLPSILYLVMHLGLFVTQIYSTSFISVGTKGFRVGVFQYTWEEVERCDILTGLHEDNHLYPSGGVARFIIGNKIYRAELKKKQIEDFTRFMEKNVETVTH
jgi:hypothetical protein